MNDTLEQRLCSSDEEEDEENLFPEDNDPSEDEHVAENKLH